jgi:hypothetical protein
MISCTFCGEFGPQSQEHIWPNWAARRLPVQGVSTIFGWSPEQGQFTKQNILAFTDLLPEVCERCNTGWMRGIEEGARRVLEPMIFSPGHVVDLAVPKQRAIARWVYLRAFVLQAAADFGGRLRTPETRLSIPEHWYRELAQDHRPRTQCRISLGSFALPNNDFRTAIFRAGQLDAGPNLPSNAQPEGHHAIFNIGHLVMTIFMYTHLAEAGREFGLAHYPGFQGHLADIFPANLKPVQWPPSVMDFNVFQRLVQTVPVAGIVGR